MFLLSTVMLMLIFFFFFGVFHLYLFQRMSPGGLHTSKCAELPSECEMCVGHPCRGAGWATESEVKGKVASGSHREYVKLLNWRHCVNEDEKWAI